MRKTHVAVIRVLPLLLAAAIYAGSIGKSRANDDDDQEESFKGSSAIRSTSESDFPRLATVPLQEAITIALARVPGGLLKAETKKESGYLVHHIEVVDAGKAIVELTIDAGNGTVLSKSLDSSDEERDDDED